MAYGPSRPEARKIQRGPDRDKTKPAVPAREKFRERVKGWSEAALAALKVFTMALAIGAVGFLGFQFIWRDQAQRQITVEVDPKVEKFMFDRGVDFDLRAELRDETTSRIQGVRSFLGATLFTDVAFGAAGGAPISFKPFGIDITTNDMAALARVAFEGEPAFRVRMELLCEPNPCDTARPDAKAVVPAPSAQPPVGERWTRLSLIVRISGPERSERLVFTMPPRPAVMRRGLRIAMQRSAEKLLEQAEPLIATVLYNNAPNIENFPDERRRHSMRAAGASLLIRGEKIREPNAARKCLGHIVLATSSLQRDDYENGFSILQGIVSDQKRVFEESGKTDSRARTCWIQAQTDQVVYLMDRICRSYSDGKSGDKLQAQLEENANNVKELTNIGADAEVEKQRVTDFAAYSDFLMSLFDSAEEISAHCTASGVPRDLNVIGEALTKFYASAPPTPRHGSVAGAFGHALRYVDRVAGSSTLAARVKILAQLRHILNPYLQESAYPGDLYLVRGQIFWNLAMLIREARKLDNPAERKATADSLLQEGSVPENEVDVFLKTEYGEVTKLAQISFENVLVSPNPYPFLFSSPNLDAMILLGDVLYAGDYSDAPGAAAMLGKAEAAYADAVRQFVDDDAPLRKFLWLGRAAARWANIRKREGACVDGAAPNPRWDEVWGLLGAAPGHRWCSIFEAGQQSGPGDLGVLGIVAPYIREVGAGCEAGATGEAAETPLVARLSFVECLARQDNAAAWNFFAGSVGTDIDKKISEALSSRLSR
ncbi:MAG: hypothetical protein WCE79_02125 [Xanthobacteraceae bacterium]